MSKPTKIQMLKDRKCLNVPCTLGGGQRLNEDGGTRPYFVDMSDPLEPEVMCVGQMHKFKDAPAGSKATPLGTVLSKRVAKLRGEREPEPEKTVADQMGENAESAPAPVQGDLPGVSERPKAKPKAKPKKDGA